jgi:hypothetical protein
VSAPEVDGESGSERTGLIPIISSIRALPGSQRLELWIVFWVALVVIALEVTTFQTLSYVNDYFTATEVLSVALMGISLGGVLTWFLSRYPQGRVLSVVLSLLPLSVLASFFVLIWLSAWPVPMMALLTIPYVLASIVISTMFNRRLPSLVYLFDLCGAGLGALLVVFTVPFLREEGSFFLLTGLASLPLWLLWRLRTVERVSHWTVRFGLLWLCVSGGLIGAHLSVDPFNMMEIAKVDRAVHGGKLFHYWYDKEGKPRYKLHYSVGSLIERIDIVQLLENKDKYTSVYNGRPVDGITRSVATIGRLDNRMPTHLKMGEDPDTLLVGPSGQGLCKAIQALGEGHVDAVEINGAIAGLMADELWDRSGRAYEGMDLTVGDVRTFLKRTDRKYDYITMLNTHRIWSMGHQGPPEYVHTVEAMRDYLDHLKPEGYVLFEERNINERADLGIRRMIHTLKAVFEERGVKEPAKHFAIWELYHGCTEEAWMTKPIGKKCKRQKLFTFVMAKKTPITKDEVAHFEKWAEDLGARPKSSKGEYRGIIWRHLPYRASNHYWRQVVRTPDIYDLPKGDRTKYNLDVVTDDIPYPYDVFRKRDVLNKMVLNIAGLSSVMVLFPALVAFMARREEEGAAESPSGTLTNLLLLGYFGALGIGYMLIEVVVIQKFGIFLTSPVYSLVVILSTMLIASGIGGYFSAGISRGKVLGALGAVVVLAAGVAWIGPLLQSLMVLPFLARVFAAVVLVSPLAFVMGMPFPYAMKLAKDALSDRHAGLMFAVNGALAAVATPVSIIVSMNYGFRFTLLVGAGVYALCLVLLALVPQPRS